MGLPILYHQGSGLDRTILGVDLDEPGAGVGDISLNVHGKILAEQDYFLDLALALPMTLPTSNDASYWGEAGVSMTPTVVAAKTLFIGGSQESSYAVRLHGELGYQIRKKYELEGMLFNDQIHYTLGASTSLEPWLGLSVDGFAAWVGSVVLEKGVYGTRIYPQEFQTGGSWQLPSGWVQEVSTLLSMSRVTFGMGIGLGASPLTPSVRVFLGIEAGHRMTLDADDDGIEDTEDGCPEIPEDMDGLGDQDGCPEDDYDSDGILDADDKCPEKSETPNGFQDDDGCPDERLDTDKDGISDDLDRCIDEAEDRDEFEDEDGCPDLDDDQDGIADTEDKCRLEAEDLDEFEDADGCPDVDNDQDGVADSLDQCPLEPEPDTEEGERDGCPDAAAQVQPQTDAEPIVPEQDSTDKTLSSLSKVLTDLAKDVQFAHATKSPTAKSNTAIQKIVTFLQEHDEIKKVVLIGHTDSVGLAKRNLFLSKRRADILRDLIVERGIVRNRIETEGKGASEPVATNVTRKGRSQNRRIVIKATQVDTGVVQSD